MDMTGLFFFAGGVAMLAHIALCALLLRGLANNGAAKEALMAIPNRPLAPTSSIRLLRARYYLPWQALPPTINELEPWVRRTLLTARITGLLCVVSMVGFLAAEVVRAGM
jgi:hypothetical protein